MICSFGENDSGPKDEKLKAILEEIRACPERPIMLNCNVGEIFSYQNPGTEDDSSEGSEFNRRRDLEILHKLDLMPGAILPARIILFRIFDTIKNVSNICGYEETTSNEWRGCEKARKGYYEKALQNVLAGNPVCTRDFYKLLKEGKKSIILERQEEELAEEKEKSLEEMYRSEEISVRPHILLCAVEQYAEGVMPPYENDNLPEMMQHIIRNPEVKIKLVEGADWMICAPCPGRESRSNSCIHGKGNCGLSNQLRDLRMMQKLGLKYGTSMKARDLYKLIFEKIKTTNEICALEGTFPSVWESGCGANNLRWIKEGKENEVYKRGREMLIDALGIRPSNKSYRS
jgi:hypothetical protein